MTANTEWSNLPISGLFVDLLRRIVDLSQGVIEEDSKATLPPLQSLNGFGGAGRATGLGRRNFAASAREAPARSELAARLLRERHRAPGSQPVRRSWDAEGAQPDARGRRPDGGTEKSASALSLMPWLLLAALLLAIADTAIGLAMRGLIRLRPPRTAGVAAAAALAFLAIGNPADAQSTGGSVPTGADARALRATLETSLAYVLTGDPSADRVSRAGLAGLSRVLRQRTSVEPAEPLGIDVERDELAFFPLLYWAVSIQQVPPSDRALEKLNRYMRSGGTILFDTRERGDFMVGALGGEGPAGRHLRRLLRGLDISTLIPVPGDHVLTKAFYLMAQFPGRWSGGRVWVERRGGRHNDGVSSVIIGSNDWAGAWAVDRFGSPDVSGGPAGRAASVRWPIASASTG